MIIYLYVKTHLITEMKYFGRTVRDPQTYNGSGQAWLDHLREFGSIVRTEIVGTFNSKLEARTAAIDFCYANRVMESPQWLNHNLETAGGSLTAWNKSVPLSEDAKQHLSELNKGTVPRNKGTTVYNDGARHYYLFESDPRISELNLVRGGLPRSEEHRAKISSALTGIKRSEDQKEKHRNFRHSEETKQLMSKKRKQHSGPNKGKTPSDDTREKQRQSVLGRQRYNDGTRNYQLHPDDPRIQSFNKGWL